MLGSALGFFIGSVQASSRSLMAWFIPLGNDNKFFGFYAFSGKATAFLGPLLFSTVVSITGSLRYGLFTVVILFLIGVCLLNLVDEEKGIKSANNQII